MLYSGYKYGIIQVRKVFHHRIFLLQYANYMTQISNNYIFSLSHYTLANINSLVYQRIKCHF